MEKSIAVNLVEPWMETILVKMEKNIDILIEKGLDTFKESMAKQKKIERK